MLRLIYIILLYFWMGIFDWRNIQIFNTIFLKILFKKKWIFWNLTISRHRQYIIALYLYCRLVNVLGIKTDLLKNEIKTKWISRIFHLSSIELSEDAFSRIRLVFGDDAWLSHPLKPIWSDFPSPRSRWSHHHCGPSRAHSIPYPLQPSFQLLWREYSKSKYPHRYQDWQPMQE